MDLAHRARLRVLHAPNGLVLGQLDVKDHQYALWVGLNPPKVGWGRSRAPPGCMSAASRGRCRGSSRGCCGRLCGTRRAGHGPRGPLGPVGCGGGRGAPPCASHRPISTLERPSPAPWACHRQPYGSTYSQLTHHNPTQTDNSTDSGAGQELESTHNQPVPPRGIHNFPSTAPYHKYTEVLRNVLKYSWRIRHQYVPTCNGRYNHSKTV